MKYGMLNLSPLTDLAKFSTVLMIFKGCLIFLQSEWLLSSISRKLIVIMQ